MEWSSWFGRSKSKTTQSQPHPKEEEQLVGVTPPLIDQVRSFTLDTFKNFPLKEEEEEGSTEGSYSEEISTETKLASGNVRKDLSDWQQRHALLILSKVKELSQLRFKLCPRYLKERQFWRIYFTLVKGHLAEYELRAIQLDKLKRLAMEKEDHSVSGANEVEMAETKQVTDSLEPNR